MFRTRLGVVGVVCISLYMTRDAVTVVVSIGVVTDSVQISIKSFRLIEW